MSAKKEKKFNRILVTCESIYSQPDGAEIQITAMIIKLEIKQTKVSGKMAIASIDSPKGLIRAIIFPSTYYQSRSILKEGNVINIKGRIDDGRPNASYQIIVADYGIAEKY